MQFKHQLFRKCCSSSPKIAISRWEQTRRGNSKEGFCRKEVSFIKYTCLYKSEGSDYFSKKVRTPWTFFCKNTRKYAYVNSLTERTDTVIKKLAVFIYVYFVVTEAQESSKLRTASLKSKILLVLIWKKLISSVGSNRRDLYLFVTII